MAFPDCHVTLDGPGVLSDPTLRCLDPTCAVCWLWPRSGESRVDWLARLMA